MNFSYSVLLGRGYVLYIFVSASCGHQLGGCRCGAQFQGWYCHVLSIVLHLQLFMLHFGNTTHSFHFIAIGELYKTHW
jgi:hypothetical protein